MLKKQAAGYGLIIPFARTFASVVLPSVKALVEAKAYGEIPDLLAESNSSNSNPFSFLSIVSEPHRNTIVDEILQAWISIRPRSRAKTAYSSLLSYTLQYQKSLPLALAVLQHFLRSGSSPHQQFYLTLASSWIDRVKLLESPSKVLEEMKTIGYRPDCGLCNFVMSSLCAVDRIREAQDLLQGMAEAECPPNAASYGIVIAAMCDAGRTATAVNLLNEMLLKEKLMPRQNTVWKVVATLKVKGEHRKAAKVIQELEKAGCAIQFGVYESLVKGCVNCHDYVMAARVIVRMANRGFVAHITTRQSVVEGLDAAGKSDLASALRQRLADMNS